MIVVVKSGMPASLSPGIKPADLQGTLAISLDQKNMALHNTHRHLLSSFAQRIRLIVIGRRVLCTIN